MERIKYKGYFIDKTEHGYRICKEDNTNIHTHLKNFTPCYKLIDNVVNQKNPHPLWVVLYNVTYSING